MKRSAFGMLIVIAALILTVFQTRPVSGDAEYTSEEQCKMCHSDKHAEWSKSRMAKAYDLLIAAGKEKDPNCLPCHTTGFNKGGFKDIESTPNLKGVQCEACHGPGGAHLGDPAGIVGSPPAAVCRECHKSSLHSGG